MLSGVNIDHKRKKLSLILHNAITTCAAHWAHCTTCRYGQLEKFVASKTAYVSNSRDIDQGNGYKWESWETGGERCKEQTDNY